MQRVKCKLASVVPGAEGGFDVREKARKRTEFEVFRALVAGEELINGGTDASVPGDSGFSGADGDDVGDYPMSVLAGVRSGANVEDEIEVPENARGGGMLKGTDRDIGLGEAYTVR